MRIVIVGYGPGGVAAAYAARMLAPESEVTVLTEERIQSHRRPGISLALEFPESTNLFIPEWSTDSLSKRKIDVIRGVSVVGGDVRSRFLDVVDSKGRSNRAEFDRLILATGGKPVVPQIPGVNLPGVFTIQTLADTRRISESLKSASPVVIVGAGFSGLETAERLRNLGKEVHLVVRSRVLRRLLEEPMSRELVARMPRDIHLHTKSPQSVAGKDHVTGLVTEDETINAGAVMFMTGVVPSVSLAQKLGLAVGPLGGVLVDTKMESSVPGVYAVGDCAEMKDTLTGKPILMPVGSAAARAGRQAGASAAGKEKVYPDVFLRLQYDRLFGVDVVCAGHSSVSAADVGVETKVTYAEDPSESMKAALVTTKEGRLIGGQVLTSRMGSVIGYQILERIQSGVTLDEQPLLKPRHERAKELLETRLGPIG
ncbi:MAG: hypothetical protein C4K47_04750 [Candidatus Thorarchaeota archaeon]|nr:MAG: hypothetical protein C4K47_04750 [Candidatus Thorarchaeota archaeon]